MSEKHKRYSRQQGKKPNVCSGKKKPKGTTGLILYHNKEGPSNKLLKARHTASPLSPNNISGGKNSIHKAGTCPVFCSPGEEGRAGLFPVAQLCPTLCEPMKCSTPGFPAPHCQSLFKCMSTESVMPSNHLILCRPILLLSSGAGQQCSISHVTGVAFS